MPESAQLPPHKQAIQPQQQTIRMMSDTPSYGAADTRAPAAGLPWANLSPATDAWTPPREPGRGLRLSARVFIGLAFLWTIGVIQGMVNGHSPARDALYAVVALCIAAVLREVAYLKRSVVDK
jgi:hypothetical protein